MIKLVYYRHNVNIPQAEMLKHKINVNELTIVLKGEVIYTVNGKRIPLHSGDGVFIQNGSFRQRTPIKSADYVSFNFSSDFPCNLPTFINGCASDVVCEIINAFDSIHQYTSNLEDKRFSLLLECLLKQIEVQRTIELEPPLVSKIKNYVRLNLDKKISLTGVSEQLHYSVSHLEMIFKQTTSLSITAYIIKKRIEKAKQLLIEQVLTLTEVAEAVGFTDYNYFSRIFKKEVGTSPLTFRKSYTL